MPEVIEMNNEKYLKGLKIHRPTISELMARQIKEAAASPTKTDCDLFAELSKESKFDLYTKESMTMARVMAHFIEQKDGPRSDYDYDKMMGGNFNNDLVGIVNIHGKDKVGFEECANRIATLAKQHYVVIIQSVFGFGDMDVPFTMFIRDMCGHVEAAWLDADWEYFRVNNAGNKFLSSSNDALLITSVSISS